MAQSRIFGVMGGSVEEPRVMYLDQTTPATGDVLALAGPVKPIEVFRIAATCVESACRHFDGKDCQLAARIVQILPVVTEALPACRIRQDCRWFEQEGRSACLRCPQVITQNYSPKKTVLEARGRRQRFDTAPDVFARYYIGQGL
jgi:hypothetical protein